MSVCVVNTSLRSVVNTSLRSVVNTSLRSVVNTSLRSVVNTSLRSVSLLIMQAAMGFMETTKKHDERCCANSRLSFNRLAVPKVLSEIRAKRAEKNHVGGISY